MKRTYIYRVRTDLRRFEAFLARDGGRLAGEYRRVNLAFPEDAVPHWQPGFERIDGYEQLAVKDDNQPLGVRIVGWLSYQDNGDTLTVVVTETIIGMYDRFRDWLTVTFSGQLLGWRDGDGDWQAGAGSDAVPLGFTRREREIADLLAQGFTQPETAERLMITATTVKTHAEKIAQKAKDAGHEVKQNQLAALLKELGYGKTPV